MTKFSSFLVRLALLPTPLFSCSYYLGFFLGLLGTIYLPILVHLTLHLPHGIRKICCLKIRCPIIFIDIQMDPFINPLNIVVDDIEDITLEPNVGLCTIINTSAPQVVDPRSFKS